MPVSEFKIDKKGRVKPEGYKIEIDSQEAAIVIRIHENYRDGHSICRIAKTLNEEDVLDRNKLSGT